MPQQGIDRAGRKITVVGTRGVPPGLESRVGFPLRRMLDQHGCDFVILLDDLEDSRRAQHSQIYALYRQIADKMLRGREYRAGVFFLVTMLEAYYFADHETTNAVLGTSLPSPDSDVETIRHPKNDLKRLCPTFKEIEHGGQILTQLNLETVLNDAQTCQSLRSLVKWCVTALREEITDKYQLANGQLCSITSSQIDTLIQNLN